MGVDVQRAINPPKRKGPMPEKSYCEETHCLDTNFEKKNESYDAYFRLKSEQCQAQENA